MFQIMKFSSQEFNIIDGKPILVILALRTGYSWPDFQLSYEVLPFFLHGESMTSPPKSTSVRTYRIELVALENGVFGMTKLMLPMANATKCNENCA
ncbi:MAG: hypothetical protein ACLVC1_01870 [Mediterraneibacter gnavus]